MCPQILGDVVKANIWRLLRLNAVGAELRVDFEQDWPIWPVVELGITNITTTVPSFAYYKGKLIREVRIFAPLKSLDISYLLYFRHAVVGLWVPDSDGAGRLARRPSLALAIGSSLVWYEPIKAGTNLVKGSDLDL